MSFNDLFAVIINDDNSRYHINLLNGTETKLCILAQDQSSLKRYESVITNSSEFLKGKLENVYLLYSLFQRKDDTVKITFPELTGALVRISVETENDSIHIPLKLCNTDSDKRLDDLVLKFNHKNEEMVSRLNLLDSQMSSVVKEIDQMHENIRQATNYILAKKKSKKS